MKVKHEEFEERLKEIEKQARLNELLRVQLDVQARINQLQLEGVKNERDN